MKKPFILTVVFLLISSLTVAVVSVSAGPSTGCSANAGISRISFGQYIGTHSIQCSTSYDEIRVGGNLFSSYGLEDNTNGTCFSQSSCSASDTSGYNTNTDSGWEATAYGRVRAGTNWYDVPEDSVTY